MNYFGTFGSTEEEALRLLMPVVDRALKAHERGNYQAYLSVITADLAKKVSEEGFLRAYREIAPQLGRLKSKTLLASLRRGQDPMLIFAAKYENTQDDIVINITFKNATPPPLITWIWIE